MQLIELKFFDFNVEYCTECKCDAVEVYDADVPDPAKLIGETKLTNLCRMKFELSACLM